MPISHKHKLIFIHNPKTAGTSIMNYFNMERRTHEGGTSLWSRNKAYWNKYKKFMVVRNPWDRFYSSFIYSKNEESYYHSISDENKPIHPDYSMLNKMNFSEFVEWFGTNRDSLRHQQWREQKHYWIDDIEVIKYENLNEDLSNFLGYDIILPVENKSTKFDYRDAYNSYLIEKVYSYYKKDVEFFNYTF